ncbi:MAG: hypothetical protein Q9201_006824, partial [Fulgogasparrea decipioides]
MLDAKVELDGRLRQVITAFTSAFADRITAPLNDAAVTAAATATATKKNKSDHPLLKAVAAVQTRAEKEILLIRKKLNEYLDDPRTKETLVSAVQDLVVQNYETFYDALMQRDGADASGGGGKKRGKGKGKGKEGE